MSDLFASAAVLLRGAQPQRATEKEARSLLRALGYLAEDHANGRESERLHRARLLEAAAQFRRIFQLEAPEAPGLVCFGAEVDPALIDPMHRGSPLLGVSGVGLSMQEAFQRCAGEGIECLSQLQSRDDVLVRRAGPENAPASALEEFVAASAPGAIGGLSWCPARRLTDGQDVLLPADICLRRPEAQRDFAPPFPLSIGSAAGTSWDAAALHALLELIERDAASLWWRGGRRGSAVPPGVGMEPLLAELRHAGLASRRSWLLDITTDIGIPTVAAVSCQADGFGFAFGLATRPTLAAAARSATLEMCQLELAYAVIEAKRRERGEEALNDRDRVHLRRATAINADRCVLLQPLAAPVEHLRIDSPDPGAALEVIAKRLGGSGIEVFGIDLTRRRFGIPVARLMAPSLQIEPSEIVSPRLAGMVARTGGGAAYTGGVSLL